MKFTIAALALTVSSAWANPLGSTDSVDNVLAGLKARTDAAFYHAGSDHVLRAVSADFEVVGAATLSERQAAEWHASLDQPLSKRAVVDERELVEKMSAHIRSNAPKADVFDLEARQACTGQFCPLRGCPSSCSCRCSGGQFEVCRCY